MLGIDSLSVDYGSNIVLRDVSFDVQPGEILALIGPNGTGKSTLIRAISGVIPIRSGRVLSGSQDLANLSLRQRARLLSVVPQARQMGGAYSVEQAVMMGRTAYMNWLGHESEADKSAVKLAMEQTCLESFADRSIAQLSGGEQQRVLLARALAQATPILLLDEPTNHLDLYHQANLLSIIRRLAKEKQLMVIVAMHDLNWVSFVADRVALIVNRELECIGTPQEVLRAERISAAYQTPVEIVKHPATGAPIILPLRIPEQDN